jgi:hypothetical protein
MRQVYSKISSAPYDPQAMCTAPSAPAKLTKDGNTIFWKTVDGAIGYLILRNGLFLAITANTSYTDETAQINKKYTYSVKSVSINGNLSASASIISSIKRIKK